MQNLPNGSRPEATARERLLQWVGEQLEAGKNRTQVAAMIGCSESGLSRIISGRRGAGGRLAAQIEHATSEWAEGPIRAVDWYPEAAQ